MSSILLGSTLSMCYSYLPMPFDNKAKLSVEYKDNGTEGKLRFQGEFIL